MVSDPCSCPKYCSLTAGLNKVSVLCSPCDSRDLSCKVRTSHTSRGCFADMAG